MSDEQVVNEQVSAVVTMRQEISSTIKDKNTSGAVRERVIQEFVEKEIDRRAKLIALALNKRDEKTKELAKVKPDQVSYANDGTVVSSYFSKDKIDSLNRLKQQISKIDTAIEACFNQADYSLLEKVLASDQPQQKGQQEGQKGQQEKGQEQKE